MAPLHTRTTLQAPGRFSQLKLNIHKSHDVVRERREGTEKFL
jgi:hypothetical protein